MNADKFDQSTMASYFVTTHIKITRKAGFSYVPISKQRKLDNMKNKALLNSPKSSMFQSDDKLEIGELQVKWISRDFQSFLDENKNKVSEYD